jgi:ribosomal protein S18 acetylase RimI-like enzyme
MTFRIIDITEKKEYEQYLYKCLAPMPYRKYRKRHEYLETAIPKGFHKKIVELRGEIVGQIEYSPAEVSGLPISGDGIFVMNCIWVLRKAKGRNLGKVLLDDVILSLKKKNAEGLATIGLENYPSPWLKRDQMEKLGFHVMKSIELRISHKKKYIGHAFTVYLMWLPMKKDAAMPYWDVEKLLKGVRFCLAHPLYHPESVVPEQIFEIVGTNEKNKWK